MQIIFKFLDQLSGFDFFFAAVLVLIGVAGWHYLGRIKPAEQKAAKSQIKFAGLIALIIASEIALHHIFFSPNYVFPKDVAGILILRIEGDDKNNSLQRDLVSTLNDQLSQAMSGQQIEVRAYDEVVTEALGLTQAHVKARKLGKDAKALLVVWGTLVGEKKFHLRLTIVEDWTKTVTVNERTLKAQNITEVSLPAELINQPIYLTHFISGFSFCFREDYATALTHFKAALSRPVENSIDLNDIRFYTGSCHWNLARGQREMAWHLEQAIAYYDTVLGFYSEQNFPRLWAITQSNWGIAYLSLPIGNHGGNLKRAIAALEASLRVFREKDSPIDWAGTQINLGAAYVSLPLSNSDENIRKAIAAYQAVLRILTPKDFPIEWAGTQNNLGNAYWRLTIGDRNENLRKAIMAHEAALRVFTKKNTPIEWARTLNNLGVAYVDLPSGDSNENLQKAIIAFAAALSVFTEKNIPIEWARTQSNLGAAYWNLSAGDRSANLQFAIRAYEAALRVFTEKDFPVEWARTQSNLGVAYADLPGGDHNDNLQKAIACFENALRVRTGRDLTFDWAMTQNNLGAAYKQLTTGNRMANLKKAIFCFENALRVWTTPAFPQHYQLASNHLRETQSLLKNISRK